MHRNLIRSVLLAATVAGLGACSEDSLIVGNPNQGNQDLVLGRPLDAENLLGTYYRRWHSGVYGSITDIEGMANQISLMNFSSLANNCQNNHTPFLGATFFNNAGNTCQSEQQRLYYAMSEVDRVVTTVMGRLERPDTAAGVLRLGIYGPSTPARDNRAKAFGEFLRGLARGYLALVYDSASVAAKELATLDPGPLRPYTEVMDSAYAALARAIVYANIVPVNLADSGQTFPLPATWIPSPTSFSRVEFIRLVQSYRARFRANVARTPAERQAANWALVIADAQAGFTANHQITASTTTGPFIGWRAQYAAFSTWHQMPPAIIGMADVSGSYATWIATPLGARGAGSNSLTLVTPDLRFPQGATRALQNADFGITSCDVSSTPCKRYFVNRAAGSDRNEGPGFGWSNYDFARFYSWVRRGSANSGQNGPTPIFMLAELRLLEAEGHYRLGAYALAGALVNQTRTAGMAGTPLVATGGGLPAITVFDATTPVPGAANCVPKVPVAPFLTSGTAIACGNLWEALKYEKRIETAYTHFIPWYLDGRGWGDLPQGTPTYWAVPFQDLLARGKGLADLYGTGPGNVAGSASGLSTYGW